MNKAVEELGKKMAEEKRDQIILNMLHKNYPVEDITEIADVTAEYVIKLRDRELEMA